MTAPRSAATAPPEPGAQAHRVIFIDFARAVAVVLMIVGHSVSALLAPAYAAGSWFDAWQFQRGLTSSLFLLLSGFAFSVATTRHWTSHTHVSPEVVRRLRRFVFFILLGYTLHFPILPIGSLVNIGDAQWRSFLMVDVLQLIGATFIVVQALVLVCRDRVVFMVVAFALAAGLIVATPWAWATDWIAVLPLWLASYLSPATGSLFPLFPFAASVLVGAGAGQIYARWGAANLATFSNRILLGAGALLVVLSLPLRPLGATLFGQGPGAFIPVEFALRTGVSFIVLGVLARASQRLTHLPRMFGAVAQESLTVYYAHLCVVYGSIWSPGLVQWIGATLRPIETLPIAIAIVAAMVLLAWQWNWTKHARPRAARWVRIAVAALVLYRLL